MTIREMTGGRGADRVVEAVGMEAHGGPVNTAAAFAITATGLLPGPLARKAVETVGIDRLAALHAALLSARRGGTVSISGVYGGAVDPMPMMDMFDRQLTIRMGQTNVRRWSDELLAMLVEEDAFGVEGLATHRLPLSQAPGAYATFQKKHDGCLKVILKPGE